MATTYSYPITSTVAINASNSISSEKRGER